MSRSFQVQQNAEGTPFFVPYGSSPRVVDNEDGESVIPSVERRSTENSVRAQEYKVAKQTEKGKLLEEPEGYSVAEPTSDVMATLTQDETGDWNIEDFLVGGLTPGPDTDAVKLALRRHVSLAVDDGVPRDKVDENGERQDKELGDELSELPTMTADQLKDALKKKGIEYEGTDVRDMREKLTSAILMDVDTTMAKYLSGKCPESDEADGGDADFETLSEMMTETSAIGIRTNGEEDWDENGIPDGTRTLIGGQLVGDSGEPLLMGESDSADLLLAASDGALKSPGVKEQFLDRYFAETEKRALSGDPNAAPYGITPPDLVGKPRFPEREDSAP